MMIPLVAQAQNPLIISNGLLGYWSFNEATGDFAFDYSGNNRHGTLSGNPTRVQGRIGGAISFNGSNQHVNLGSFLSGETEFSFVTWLKPIELENWSGIIAKYVDDNNCVTLQTEADGKIAFDVDEATAVNNYGETSSSAVLSNDVWAHIAMTYNGGGATNADRIQIYVNGVAKTLNFTGDIATSTITGSTAVVVGALNTSNLVALNGVVDDVRIYNRKLSEFEVKQLYLI